MPHTSRSALGADPESQLRACIETFVRESPANCLQRLDGGPIFEAPLVAYASGDDPLFQRYKEIIGPFHLTPREVLRLGAGGPAEDMSGGGVSVICWVLPIARSTRESNRTQREEPSVRWAHTRHYGEQFNDALRRHVVETLRGAGYLAVAPVISPLFKIHGEGISHPPASTWSERHVLYVAGLGTFSLSDGFITARGIAMRCGSVVTDLPLRPSTRPYAAHTANCLYLSEGTCGACIARCPAGAISAGGHDKQKCQAYTYGALLPWRERYQVDVVGCGLCQTGVPCEEEIPAKTR